MLPTDPGHSDKFGFCVVFFFFLWEVAVSECTLHAGKRMKCFADQKAISKSTHENCVLTIMSAEKKQSRST